MGDHEPLPVNCPQCGQPILAVYKPDPKVAKEVPNRFECPWCHRNAVLYVPGWLAAMVTKRSSEDEGESGVIRLVVPRLTKARTRTRRGTRGKVATTKRRKAPTTKRRKAAVRRSR